MTEERETQVREHIASRLSDLFNVTQLVEGQWPIDGSQVELDLLLRPNNKAVDLGMSKDDVIGVEVKDPESTESVKKLLDCIMQSHSYTFCEFQGLQPDFVLIYPDIDKFFNYDWEHKYKNSESEKPTSREIRLLKRIMQRANVGELLLEEQKYTFQFSGGPYFRSDTGRSGIQGIGKVRQIGSQKFYK